MVKNQVFRERFGENGGCCFFISNLGCSGVVSVILQGFDDAFVSCVL